MNSVHAWGARKNLEELALKIDRIKMNLKDLKRLLKSIRGFYKLNNLKLDVKIEDKNDMNMLKSFSHIPSLS